MLRNLLIIVLLLLVGLGVAVFMQPDTFHIERSRVMDAPPEVVYALASDLKKFEQWSPWEKRDPNMTKTFSDATSGPGASYAWSGNDQVGKGKMTITSADAPNSVDMELEFIEPFPSVAKVRYDLKAEGDKTKFTWSMDGKNDFVGKAMSLMMDFDAVVGKDFEEGMASLNEAAIAEAKRRAEAVPAVPASAPASAPADGATEELPGVAEDEETEREAAMDEK